MGGFVQNEITKQAISTMRKALKRLSSEHNCNAKDIQLVIKFDGEQVAYSCMRNYEKIEDMTFNDILGVKFDFKQREYFTAPFLQQSIVRIAEETNSDVKDISSIIITKDDKADKVYILAYNKNDYYKQITFNWLFDNPEEVLQNII